MPEEVKSTVLENGLEFIHTALSHLSGEPSPRDLKYAVLHLSAGIELVLKDLLSREHWSLVFESIEKATKVAYESGDFVSVNLKTSIQRLTQICGVEISENEQRSLFNLRRSRNRLEHFAIIDSPIALKASSAKVLSFTLDFISSEFAAGELAENETKLLEGIRNLLPEFEQFVESRMNEIKGKLASEAMIVDCPRCTQKAMKIDDGAMCLFCGFAGSGEDAAKDYVELLHGLDWKHVADGGEIPIFLCPECGSESLVDVGALEQDLHSDRFVCFSCGNGWGWNTMAFCERCGSPTPHDSKDGLPICDDCWREWMDKE